MSLQAQAIAKGLVQRLFRTRLPSNPLYRLLAYEYQARHLLVNEAQRILYYQPMFEARCAAVGARFRLELCPDSKFPSLSNVKLRLGADVRMSARTSFSGGRRAKETPVIEIGDGSYIGHRCVLRAGTHIRIGKNVLIATNALLSGDPGHPLDAVARRTEPAPAETLGSITIGDDAWLAYNVSVVGKVNIGRGAVIAAGSVVTKDVPDFALVAGNPARVIRQLSAVEDAGERVSRISSALVSTGATGDTRAPANPLSLIHSAQSPDALRDSLRQLYRELFLAPGEGLDAESLKRLDAAIDAGMGEYRRLLGSRPESSATVHRSAFKVAEESP